jgi:hypothetical protein
MIYVQLTNGFGNNMFQYVAARLLATYLHQDLVVVPPTEDYYGIEELGKLGVKVGGKLPPGAPEVNDINYIQCFDERLSNRDLIVRGYFENYKFFKENISLIKSWLPAINSDHSDDLILHFRAGDRLLYKNEFDTKPQVESYINAINQFDFNNLYIVTDMPYWDKITVSDLQNMKFHVDVPDDKRVSAQRSVDYFNSIVKGLGQFSPQLKKGTVAEDFNFIRGFGNILFQHGTLCWWAATLSEAKKVGVYGPWRPWKGDSNKNLSDVGLEGWFKWT